jgi:hypothetical protein
MDTPPIPDPHLLRDCRVGATVYQFHDWNALGVCRRCNIPIPPRRDKPRPSDGPGQQG